MKAAVDVFARSLEGLGKAIDELDKKIASAHAQSEISPLIDSVPGIGKHIASMIAATVADPG